MKKKYPYRIELRIGEALKNKMIRTFKGRNRSDIAREALERYVDESAFKTIVTKMISKKESRKSFIDCMNSSSEFLKFFEGFIGPDEEKLVDDTPIALLPALKDILVTQRGLKALQKKGKS